jgi:toxin secretion/phage lysis holin
MNMKEWGFSDLASIGKVYAASIGGALGSAGSYLYGDGSVTAIKLFLLLIAMDWLSGIAASKKDGSYTSAYGISGIYRTGVILLFPACANYIDKLIGTPETVFYFVISGLAFHIFNSVAANCVRAGWGKWIPSKLIRFVQSEIEAKQKRSENKK